LDNDVILSQFDDVDEKVEYLIDLCRSLSSENEGLKKRITILEREVEKRSEAEKRVIENKEKIRLKISQLLEKLNEFSEIST
jgi:regulator of replication initiation timing